jgi:hypothetical protein
MATYLFDCCLIVDITDNDFRTPLRAAASNGHLDVTRELLSNGDSVHIEGNVTEEQYRQKLIVTSWKFPLNS